MSLKESLLNILDPDRFKKAEELKTVSEAIEQKNQLMVAFLEGKISLEEYYQHLAETYPITKTEYMGLASESDRRRYFHLR